ncbi:hypothetical protein Syun_010382 [Stephania yunnanensis]|uniref:Uncharacterized protein n=1 Tax=Stephania yunnanensis TaxID=152371 RepID=A0AAP0KI00_9MAGN
MEPKSHKVKVLQVCNIAPPPLSVSKYSTLPLTLFDLPYLIRPPAELLLFYTLQPIDHDYFLGTIVHKIKHSLSLTLQHWYPLSGTLSWPPQSNKPIITYNNGDSVRLTVAESSADFDHLSTSNYAKNVDELHHLMPQLMSINYSKKQVIPLLALQITLFPHKGVCIGVISNHAAMDGRAVSLFLTSWASVCRLGNEPAPSVSLLPTFDRQTIKDPNGLEKMYLEGLIRFVRSKSMSENDCNNWLLVSMSHKVSENSLMATFDLTNADIERLRRYWTLACKSTEIVLKSSSEGKEGHEAKPIKVSRFVLACAFTWICLTKTSYQHDEQAVVTSSSSTRDEQTSIVFLVDCRGRTDPPIPPTYIGNCCVPMKVSAKVLDIVSHENGIVVAVDCIVKAMRGLSVAVANDPELRLSRTLNTSPNYRTWSIAGSPQFGFCKIDFGFGRPKKFEFLSMARTGSILFSDSGNEGVAMEIGLVRRKQEMDSFAHQYFKGLHDLVCKSSL